MGIGPTYLPWEGNALPLSYGRRPVHWGVPSSVAQVYQPASLGAILVPGDIVTFMGCRVKLSRVPALFQCENN